MSSLLKRFDADTSEESSHPSKKPRQSEASHSGTSESSSSSSSSAESFVKVPKGKSELLLANLAMFPGEDGGQESNAAKNGKNRQRIKALFKDGLCKCKRNCRAVLSQAMVVKLCYAFWGLTKAAQDCVLWGLQNMRPQRVASSSSSASGDESDASSSSSPTSSPRVMNTWSIEGGPLFRSVLCALRR